MVTVKGRLPVKMCRKFELLPVDAGSNDTPLKKSMIAMPNLSHTAEDRLPSAPLQFADTGVPVKGAVGRVRCQCTESYRT